MSYPPNELFPPGYRARERGVCRGRGFPNLRYDGLGRFFPLQSAACRSELVRTVRHPIRVPKIILLSIFDKMPKKELKIDSQKRFRAGQASVPVLRQKAAARRLEFGSCDSQALRGQDDLGEYRLLLYQVQFPKSKPATTRGWHAFDTQAVEAAMATGDQYRHLREKHKEWRHFIDVAYWNVELES